MNAIPLFWIAAPGAGELFITWRDLEGDDLQMPLEKMNPGKLDTDQWVATAEAMGAKYIVFVAKHVGGFCMWRTETTDYSIASTSWRSGKGDVLKDLAESCRKRGMKLGVYLSPCDRKHGASMGGKCPTSFRAGVGEIGDPGTQGTVQQRGFLRTRDRPGRAPHRQHDHATPSHSPLLSSPGKLYASL
jgi:hypothetical protein